MEAAGPVRGKHGDLVDSRHFEHMDAEVEMNTQLHLVPCRWERSGWRYVQKDPQQHGFFSNPNRVNSFGVAPDKKRYVSQNKSGGGQF